MVAARMMLPLRGDLATRLAPQRFWFGMEVSGPLPLLAELVMAHQGWQTDGQAQRAKIRCRKRREPGTMRSDKFPPPNLKKPVQARAAWQIWLRWCHSAVQRT